MNMGPLLYVFLGVGVLFLLIVAGGIWRIVTFRSPLLHSSPAAYERLRVEPLAELPEGLRTQAVEEEAADLAANGFEEIGGYTEVLGSAVPTRQLYSKQAKTYASIFTTDNGEPYVSYLTAFDDGMLLFTCTTGSLAGIYGKLISQAEPNPDQRWEVHSEELSRMREDGSAPRAKGTLEDRMRLCKEWYRYYTGAYKKDDDPEPDVPPA